MKQKKQLSPQLIKLLKKTRAFILKHPEKFDQGNDNGETHRDVCETNRCGTPQCILGWMRRIYRGKKRVEQLFPKSNSEEVSDRLYYASLWPKQFQLESENYSSVHWSCITAKTAAKRITHFIRTDGRK